MSIENKVIDLFSLFIYRSLIPSVFIRYYTIIGVSIQKNFGDNKTRDGKFGSIKLINGVVGDMNYRTYIPGLKENNCVKEIFIKRLTTNSKNS